MSKYLTKSVANAAMDMVAPSIKRTQDRVAKRKDGHLRVAAMGEDGWKVIETWDFGNPEAWEHPYKLHAMGKEAISIRTGLSSRKVQMMHPELLEPGDTIYFGSVVSDGGTIIVSFSGVEAYFDEMFAKWLSAACEGLIEHKLQMQKEAGKTTYVV